MIVLSILFLSFQSNYVALSESELESLPVAEVDSKVAASYEILGNVGSHYVIDSVVNLPDVVQDINRRLFSESQRYHGDQNGG